MQNLIFLKLGGSLITDKSQPYTLRPEVLGRLCREIHEARVSKKFSLLLGHGGGSFPHVSAKKYQTHKGIIHAQSWEGFCKVQDDAARLNRIVVNSLLQAGENAVSMQPSAACLSQNGHIREWDTRPLEILLQAELLPVPYGDVCLDTQQGCCIVSTEEILGFLASRLKPTRIIMAGKTDGVLDNHGEVIREITTANLADIQRLLMSSDGIADVTGGMIHKVQKSLEFRIPTEIINGLQVDVLKRALMGEVGLGTVIDGGK